MATITIGRNAPTKVKSLSLYKIEEESDQRLVLRAKGGDEFKVDESSDFELMSGLAEKIARLSSVRMHIAQPR